MEQLFGLTLQSKTGSVRTSSLTAKYKLIFFSAHWCSPCRAFTAKLALFYEQVNSVRHQLDIIFVSLDREPGEFNEYFGSMPWLALPFVERPKAQYLAWKFGANGIPHLILLDNQGRKKSSSCRDDVISKGPVCLTDWDRALNR